MPLIELDWFLLTIWVSMTALSYVVKRMPILAMAAIYGLYLSYSFYDLGEVIGLLFFAVNCFILYDALDNWDRD